MNQPKPKLPARPPAARRPYGNQGAQSAPRRKYAPMRRMLTWAGLVISGLFWLCFALLYFGAQTGEQNIFLNAVIVLGPMAAFWLVLAPVGFFTIPQPRQKADLIGLILSCTGSFSVLATFVWLVLTLLKVL